MLFYAAALIAVQQVALCTNTQPAVTRNMCALDCVAHLGVINLAQHARVRAVGRIERHGRVVLATAAPMPAEESRSSPEVSAAFGNA